jgi:hypothetical protein
MVKFFVLSVIFDLSVGNPARVGCPYRKGARSEEKCSVCRMRRIFLSPNIEKIFRNI